MIRTETERQFYLGAAGIRLWYARSPLPGAAPSPEFEFPPEQPRAEQAAPVPIPSPGVPTRTGRKSSSSQGRSKGNGARIADLQALMGEQPVARKVPAPEPAATASVPEAVAETEKEPETRPAEPSLPAAVETLDVRIWAGGRVALIVDLSADASLRLQEALAENILASLGERQPRDLGRIGWPIFNNLRVPGSSAGHLVEVLRSVLAGLQEHDILVLGQASGGSGHSIEEALGRPPAVSFPHSLAELAGDPGLKRTLWGQIKPLVSR